MNRHILRSLMAAGLAGFAFMQAAADQQVATAVLNAPVVSIGGNSDYEWGPIVSQGNMSLQGAADVHYPQKFAGGIITAKGGSAGNATYCQNGPATDGKEYTCGMNPAPDFPHINFADYRALAQLEGNSCAGQPCLNPTGLSGIQDSVCTVNGQPKVWFFDGSPKFSGSTSFCGVLVSLGAVTFNGSGTGTSTVTPPANAWLQYQVGTPAGGPDTSASNQYPGDSGFQQSNTPVTLNGVSFTGYIYTTDGYSAAGGALIVGAVQFGSGNATTQGGATIYFSSQSVIVQPKPGTVDQPIIFPASGCSSSPITITIIDASIAQGASVYYTLDGSTPNQSSNLYAGRPFTLNNNLPSVTLTAIGIQAGMTNSDTASATFTFSAQCVVNPNPPPGITFWANPTSITKGANSILNWTISNANSATIDQGIGTVSPISSGNFTVTPSITTIYKLTATGPGGTSTAQATVTVFTVPPPVIQFDSASYSVSEDAGFANITVTRQGDLSGASTVNYATVPGGTAAVNQDYLATSGILTFNPNDWSKTFEVPVINDGQADGPETVALVLAQPTGATLGLSAATLTINDQNPPVLPPPNPIINQLIPYSAPVNQIQPVFLRILGSGFDPNNALVFWNATTPLTNVSSMSATEIDLSFDPSVWNNTASTYTIIVRNPGPLDSNPATFTVEPVGVGNPAPSLSSLAPNSALEGSNAFTLTVNGENFRSGAAVLWNGSPRATTFMNITQLTASISAADVANSGSASVAVQNPDSQLSNVLPFAIVPLPTIQFNPASYTYSESEGFVPVTVTRQGVNLAVTSTVQFATTAGANTTAGKNYVDVSGTLTFGPNETTKTFDVPLINDGLADGGAMTVLLSLSNLSIANPGNPMNATLTITDVGAANPQPPSPFIKELVPYSAPVGFGSNFPMRVLGSGFLADAQVHWNFNGNDSVFPTAVVVSSSEIDVTVLPGQVIQAGQANVTVVNVSAALTSNQAVFTIRPTINGNPPPLAPWIASGPLADPNPTFTNSTTLSVRGGTFSSGGEAGLHYRWTQVGTFPAPKPATLTPLQTPPGNAARDTVAIFYGAGTYHFQVEVIDPTTHLSVLASTNVVVVQRAVSFELSPQSQTMTPDQTLMLKLAGTVPNQPGQPTITATVKDQFGNLMTPDLTWNNDAGSLAKQATYSVLSVDPTVRKVHITAVMTNPDQSKSAVVDVIFGSGGVGNISQAVPAPVPYKVTSGLPGVDFLKLVPGTKVRLFTTTGRLVQTLNSGSDNHVLWRLDNAQGDRVSSGVYLYTIEGAGQKKEGKVVLIL